MELPEAAGTPGTPRHPLSPSPTSMLLAPHGNVTLFTRSNLFGLSPEIRRQRLETGWEHLGAIPSPPPHPLAALRGGNAGRGGHDARGN